MAAERSSVGQTAAAGGVGAGVDWLPYLFALLFFAKALILGFWVTPLWQAPDERQHFHYAQEIAMGKGLPVLGQAPVDTDFDTGFKRALPGRTVDNYIAQHPPLYYVLAAGAWRVATAMGGGPDDWFRAPRIVSALAGAGTLLVIYQLMLLLTARRTVSLAVMAAVSFLPTYSYMSSGAGNDGLVTLLASLAVLYWCRYLTGKRVPDAYACAVWLALACVTKMTALVLAAPMLAILVLESDPQSRRRWLHVAGWLGTAASLPALWMARNAALYGNPLMTAADQTGFFKREETPLAVSFTHYLANEPVIEGYFSRFYSMFVSPTRRLLLDAQGVTYTIFSVLALALVLLALYRLIGRVFGDSSEGVARLLAPRWSRPILALALAVVAVIGFEWIWAPDPFSPRRALYAALAAAFILGPTVFLTRLGSAERVPLYALTIIGLFVLALLWKAYGFYLLDGQLRAIQGRYLFPLLPLMLIGLVLPAVALLKFRDWLLVALAVGLGVMELHVFFDQVMPFYRGL